MKNKRTPVLGARGVKESEMSNNGVFVYRGGAEGGRVLTDKTYSGVCTKNSRF